MDAPFLDHHARKRVDGFGVGFASDDRVRRRFEHRVHG
jgi:hypothetical protein